MMTGFITKASVDEYVKENGLTPVQIDGIPEGFVFRGADLEVGGIEHRGSWIFFTPFQKWSEGIHHVDGKMSREDLSKFYNKIRNGKR